MNKEEIEKMPAGKAMDALIAKTFKMTPLGEYSTSLFWAIVLIDACEGMPWLQYVLYDENRQASPLALCRAALLATL